MNVTFKMDQKLGNRPFKKGAQTIPDHLSGNQEFKRLVVAGKIVVHPRDSAAITLQASKDSLNAKKAEIARRLGLKIAAAHASGARPHTVTEAAVPGTIQKIIDKKTAKKKPIPVELIATPFVRPTPDETKTQSIDSSVTYEDTSPGEGFTIE